MKRSVIVAILAASIIGGAAVATGAWALTRSDTTGTAVPTPVATTAPVPTHSPPPDTPGPTPLTPNRLQVIDYTNGGTQPGPFISDPAKLGAISSTSADFQAFVAATVSNLKRDNPDCTGDVGVTVSRYVPSSYALGGVTACGGYAAIWSNISGHWKEVIGTQDIWQCEDLATYAVPPQLLGDPYQPCYNAKLRKTETYVG